MRRQRLRAGEALIATLLIGGCDATSRHASPEPSVHEGWYASIDSAMAKGSPLERCHAYPSPPSYDWPAELIDVLCADRWEPVANADFVRPLIDKGDWEALHDHYARLLRRHHDGIDPELLLYRAFPEASWRSEKERDDYTSRWLKAAPNDAYASLLRAEFRLGQAWKLRGFHYASEIPSERMHRVRVLAQEAIRLAKRTVEAEPGLLPAYGTLLSGAALTGDQELFTKALETALRHAPHSYYVRSSALNFLEPQWGGSIEEMDHLVEQAQKHLKSNPRLILLRTQRAALEGNRYSLLKQHGPALDAYRRALAHGPALRVVNYAASTARDAGQHAEAVMLLTQALRFDRDQQWGLTGRGIEWQQLGEYPRALRDFAAAAEAAPGDPDPIYRMAWLEQQRQNFKAAEGHYLRLFKIAPDRADALADACRMWVHLTLEPRKAKPYAERLTVLRPDDPDSWLLLANIHHSLGDPAVHISARRFLELAAPDDPRWKNSVEIINRFLAAPAAEQQQR